MTKATIAIVSITNLPAKRFADGEPVEMLGLAYKKDGELFAAVPMLVREDEAGNVRTDEEMVAAVTAPFPILPIQADGYEKTDNRTGETTTVPASGKPTLH